MSDFRLKVQAELDATKLEGQINELKNKEIPLKFKATGLDGLDSKSLKYIDKLKSKDVNVNFNVTGIDSLDRAVDNLKSISGTKGKKINIEIGGSKSIEKDISNYKLLKDLANELSKKKISLAGLDVSKDGNKIAELKKQITSLETEYNKMFQSSKDKLSENQIASLTQVFSKIKNGVSETKAKMLDMADAPKKVAKAVNQLDVSTFINRIGKTIETNTKLTDEWIQKLQELQLKAAKVTNVDEFSGVKKQYSNFMSEIGKEGLLGLSFADKFKKSFGQIFQFSGIYAGIQNVIFEIPRQIVASVKEIDSAMTNLYKVTDETEARYAEFQKTAANTSKSIGRSMSSYITQVSEWSKLGYTMNQAETLAKNSSIYANVGEVEDTRAVSDMVTAMKAFNIEASNSISVVDSLNKLGNNYAVSSADLGEGLSNSASALASAGNDINQSLAMITGMTEITQLAGESGNALKILSMRLRGYDEETESYTNDVEELSGKIADLTKTAKTPGGISLFTDETKTTYKSTYQLLKDISDVYDNLTDKNRARLLEVIAGKSRGNQVAALLQAFKSGQVEKAYNDSLNSEGSAQQEQDRWAKSIEAKIAKFKASFEALSTNTLDSDIFKFAVDSGTAFVDVLNKIVSVGNGIPTLFASIAGIKIFKNLD